MRNFSKLALLSIVFLTTAYCAMAQQSVYPKSYGALPTARHLSWQEMETYVLIHFTPTTFENKEWGFGDADPKIFNPSAFDATQIVNAAKAGGFKGVIFVAKHHDGFCLWPSKTTSYNISQSPWKNGKGDMVKEFQLAAQAANMKFGVYCSPWDRNNPNYGTYEYVKTFRKQLEELYTGYGNLFITWFDGANGGDGYYGGTREARKIDRTTYYGWDTTFSIVRKLQPNAVVFSDVGDVRWVGNESGYAAETSWATFTPEPLDGKTIVAPGEVKYWKSPEGTRNGKFWKPAECDVALRPGWFYHAEQDHQVKTPWELLDLYFKSVGRGACLDLGLSPDTRGLLNDKDVTALAGFGKLLEATFKVNLAKTASIQLSNIRGKNTKLFGARQLTDDNRYTYWATDDAVKTPNAILEWTKPQTFNIIRIRENIKLGQRIEKLQVDIFENNQWKTVATATSIGANRLIRLPQYVTSKKVRIKVLQSPVSVAISDIAVFKGPEQMAAPEISRTADGYVRITSSPSSQIKYTLDGTDPGAQSTVYAQPFLLEKGGTLKAKVVGSDDNESEIITQRFTAIKKGWTITSDVNQTTSEIPSNSIDDNRSTVFRVKSLSAPVALVVDMKQEKTITAFSYLPPTDPSMGFVKDYEWQVSNDGTQWTTVAQGEFSNIKANPVEQMIPLSNAVNGRYFKLIIKNAVDNNGAAIAELGVMEK